MADIYRKKSDDEVLKGLMAGDEDAFTELYKRYFNRLLYISEHIVKSREVAEGIVQETLIRMWEKRRNIKANSSLKALTYTIVRNLSLNYLRDNANRERFERTLFEHSVQAFYDTENRVLANFLEQHLDEIIAALPDRMRSIFRLSRDGGMSHEDIANHLSVSRQVVSNTISKVMKRIREGLKDIGAAL